MSFGAQILGSDGLPLSSSYVPGDAIRALQGSQIKNTDGSSNISAGVVSSDAIREAILLGRGFTANYEANSAPSTGWYVLSLFNPNGSGKTGIFYSLKTFANYGNGPSQIFPLSADPAYANAGSIINQDNSSVITSVFNATNQTAIISPPSFATRWDYTPYSTSDNEAMSNGTVYKIAPNKGIAFYVYTSSTQEYAFQVKWIEI